MRVKRLQYQYNSPYARFKQTSLLTVYFNLGGENAPSPRLRGRYSACLPTAGTRSESRASGFSPLYMAC